MTTNGVKSDLLKALGPGLFFASPMRLVGDSQPVVRWSEPGKMRSCGSADVTSHSEINVGGRLT